MSQKKMKISLMDSRWGATRKWAKENKNLNQVLFCPTYTPDPLRSSSKPLIVTYRQYQHKSAIKRSRFRSLSINLKRDSFCKFSRPKSCTIQTVRHLGTLMSIRKTLQSDQVGSAPANMCLWQKLILTVETLFTASILIYLAVFQGKFFNSN